MLNINQQKNARFIKKVATAKGFAGIWLGLDGVIGWDRMGRVQRLTYIRLTLHAQGCRRTGDRHIGKGIIHRNGQRRCTALEWRLTAGVAWVQQVLYLYHSQRCKWATVLQKCHRSSWLTGFRLTPPSIVRGGREKYIIVPSNPPSNPPPPPSTIHAP